MFVVKTVYRFARNTLTILANGFVQVQARVPALAPALADESFESQARVGGHFLGVLDEDRKELGRREDRNHSNGL